MRDGIHKLQVMVTPLTVTELRRFTRIAQRECDLRAGLDERTTMILTHLGHHEVPRDLPRTLIAEDLARFTFR